MGGLLHLVQRRGDWAGRGRSPPMPLLVIPNVTAHPSTASVPITVFLYNGSLLCGFNLPIKGTQRRRLTYIFNLPKPTKAGDQLTKHLTNELTGC